MKDFRSSLLITVWFLILAFPLVAVRVDIAEETVIFDWERLIWLGLGTFLISYFWRYLLQRKQEKRESSPFSQQMEIIWNRMLYDPKVYRPFLILLLLFFILYPFMFSAYQTSILATALIYIVLGLGLNIVVGLAGLLDLGFVAFYAVGAYSYALLHLHFDLGFWTVLPLGGILAIFAGILLGFPVLRLRGDYIAIVTLGFGEIIRLVLQNSSEITQGPRGIPDIPKPTIPGVELSFEQNAIFIYYVLFILTIITIIGVNRLKNSRIGRSWLALREDDLACQAMGIDRRKTKLHAFALGAFWAGFVGVLYAAKTSFVHPQGFSFMESAIILCIVVLGGMGSSLGVILAGLVIVLVPEYLRAFEEYRMVLFGAALIIMMIFRPQGLISNVQTKYQYEPKE